MSFVSFQALQESAGLDRLVRQTQLVAHLESMLFSSLLTCAPKQLLAVLRWGALLTASHMRTLNVRPNDPRENRVRFCLLIYVLETGVFLSKLFDLFGYSYCRCPKNSDSNASVTSNKKKTLR